MAYQEHVINSHAEILPLIKPFADSVGWVTTLDGANPVLTYTGGDAPIPYKLVAGSSSHSFPTLVWEPVGVTGAKKATMVAPIFATDAAPSSPFSPAPTKVFLISAMTPQPYFAIVVEYGFNLMRHLYFGYMEKVGDYTGGEVVSAVNGYNGIGGAANLSYLELANYGCKWLFSGGGTADLPQDERGGVMVTHANNPNPWRHFALGGPTTTNSDNSFPDDAALGGFRDAINDGYLARGENSIGNANPLVPIELLIVRKNAGDTLFRPIGRPAGVRMLNLKGLETYGQVTLGSDVWHWFPAISKQQAINSPRAGTSNGFWRKQQTSYQLGYAYKE